MPYANIRSSAYLLGIPLALVAAATLALLTLNSLLPPNLIWLGYLLPVVIASARWGFLASAVTAASAALAGDFFFTQPYYSLWMDNPHDVTALLLFLLAALVAALLIDGSRKASYTNAETGLSTDAATELSLELHKRRLSHEALVTCGEHLSDASFTHELRTSLTTILGAASVLEASSQTRTFPIEKTLVKDIKDEALHLDHLLRKALCALRVTVQGARANVSWTDPVDLIRCTIDNSTYSSETARITTKIEPELPLVKIDPVLFAEGCGQLLSDAAKASAPTTRIEVSLHRDSEDVVVSLGLARLQERVEDAMSGAGSRTSEPLCSPSFGAWVASSLIQAAGGVISFTSGNRLYGPIATVRLPTSEKSI